MFSQAIYKCHTCLKTFTCKKGRSIPAVCDDCKKKIAYAICR